VKGFDSKGTSKTHVISIGDNTCLPEEGGYVGSVSDNEYCDMEVDKDAKLISPTCNPSIKVNDSILRDDIHT